MLRSETVAAAIAVGGVVAASIVVAPSLGGVLGAGLGVVAIAIAVVDARHFIIPDRLIVLGGALGLVAACIGTAEPWITAGAVLLRGGTAALTLLVFRELYRVVRRREGFGLGDVKLAGLAGVWLDWTTLVLTLEVAALAALAVYAGRRLAAGRRPAMMDRIPFGLFLAPTIWAGWLFEGIIGLL
ncbi:hypothetical protein RHODGE_RHODGE_04097 [Rhodoplanes serenus]|uniref:Prepilin type IV endopeptidase peptidase domain-containing protein n=1 Tax=Rhodoplanes serenus TaxID=200615 RepID=A0A3S4FES1_9BRAD|nr:A24 family peptidase [Rhodoplanes serenus]VCU10498.1 hypothetical protein RHODGE_RHODGE_04097 [Rhodoplanes serenus]